MGRSDKSLAGVSENLIGLAALTCSASLADTAMMVAEKPDTATSKNGLTQQSGFNFITVKMLSGDASRCTQRLRPQ